MADAEPKKSKLPQTSLVSYLETVAKDGCDDEVEIVKILISDGVDVNLGDGEGHAFTPLEIASLRGFTAIAEVLINAGADVNKQSESGTALMFAASMGNEELVGLLLKAGASANIASNSGATPMAVAVGRGHENVVRLLKPFVKEHSPESVLLYQCIGNAKQDNEAEGLVRDLISNGADVNLANGVGLTILMCAALSGHPTNAEILINAGADVNRETKDGKTALMLAAMSGNEELVGLLLKTGASPNISCNDGSTAMIMAALRGHKNIEDKLKRSVKKPNSEASASLFTLVSTGGNDARFLVQDMRRQTAKGADVNWANAEGVTTLMRATLSGLSAAVVFLINAGADINQQTKNGETAFMFAVSSGNYEIVGLLHKAIALADETCDVKDYVASDGTPVMTAITFSTDHKNTESQPNQSKKETNDSESASLFLRIFSVEEDEEEDEVPSVQQSIERGADVNWANARGETSLMSATHSGLSAIVGALINAGADVNQQTKLGNTALIIAASEGNEKIAAQLLAAGALPDLANKSGATATSMAASNGHENILDQLNQHKEKV